MTREEKRQLESFLSGGLKGRECGVVSISGLADRGFDVSLLQEMIASYNRLPLRERKYLLRFGKGNELSVTKLP